MGVEEAVAIDEAGLRQVFRARSLELHPDVVPHQWWVQERRWGGTRRVAAALGCRRFTS